MNSVSATYTNTWGESGIKFMNVFGKTVLMSTPANISKDEFKVEQKVRRVFPYTKNTEFGL